jgi:very-short-patch-repair endonuclease
MFKKVATLDVKSVYATDSNGVFDWRSFVKQANEEPSKAMELPVTAYKYDTDHFVYITARMISGMERWGHNGNYDAFPWEEIKKAMNTAVGKGFYIEHKEDSDEDAKGIILDVFPNNEEEYLTALCAISKDQYPEFCQQLINGIYNQVSMSCLAEECECLTPGTHILTPEGQTKIQDIKVGDYVLTHKGRFRKVLETFKNPMPEYTYKIYYESGRNNQVVNDNNRYNGTWIRATGSHPVYMADGTWKKAEDIKEGDYVKCLTKKCVVCGKDIVFSKKQKYCSASCQNKDTLNRPNAKEKRITSLKKTVKNRTEEDKKILHESLSNGQKKFQQSANYKQRKKEMSIKRNETFKKHIEDGTLDNERQRRKEWMRNAWKNPQYREKMVENARENVKKLAHKKRSFLEEKFEGFLIREGLKKDVDYKTNDFLYIDKLRAYPDFKFEKQKLIVEIDGEYWHNNPKAIKRDSYKNKIWEENGWTVIRYTGKQVNNEFEKVKDSFRRIFKNHNHEYTFGDFKVIKVEKIKTTPKCHNVYNLHVEEDESYIAENLVVHNCSLCHNVAHSFDELCQHQNPNLPMCYLKGKQDDNGNDIYEINRNLSFTGLSAVEVPADKDAFIFDIKASKKKENTAQQEFLKYTAIKKASKMKELKTACEEEFNKLDRYQLLNRMESVLADINSNAVFRNENLLLDDKLSDILEQMIQLQVGLNLLNLSEVQQNNPPVIEKEVIVEEPNKEDALQEEVNLDREIDSYLSGDNESYTPFSSTASKISFEKKAGTWAIPDTVEKAIKLKSLMQTPLDSKTAEDVLSGIVDDDKLFDKIDKTVDRDPKADVRQFVKECLMQWVKQPVSDFKFDDKKEFLKARKIWKDIINMPFDSKASFTKDIIAALQEYSK